MLTGRRIRAWREGNGGWRNIGVWTSRTAAQNRDTSQYSPDAAVQLAPVTAVVSYIARAAASSDLVLEERTGDGTGEVVTDGLPSWLDPARRPNLLQSRYEFIYNVATNLLVGGNAGVRILDRRAGVPDTIVSIPSGLLSVYVSGRRVARDEYIPGYGGLAELKYVVDDATALDPYTSLSPDGDLLHMRLITRDDLVYGMSPLQWAAPPLRIALAADAYAEYGFTTPWPHGILSGKGKLTKEAADAVAADFEKIRANPDKVHIPIVSSGDWDFVTTYIPPEQLQLLDTRKFAFSLVCAIYGVPEAMVSSPNAQISGTAFRAMLSGYAKGTQIPFNNMLAAYLSELVPGYVVRLVPRHLTELDPLEQSRVFDRYLRNGTILRSEVRKELGLPPIADIDSMPMPGGGTPGDGGGDSDSGPDDGMSDERFTNEEG